jgi:hypothetical protein
MTTIARWGILHYGEKLQPICGTPEPEFVTASLATFSGPTSLAAAGGAAACEKCALILQHRDAAERAQRAAAMKPPAAPRLVVLPSHDGSTKCRIGRGTKIHLRGSGNGPAYCGLGNRNSRSSSAMRVADDVLLTCHSCGAPKTPAVQEFPDFVELTLSYGGYAVDGVHAPCGEAIGRVANVIEFRAAVEAHRAGCGLAAVVEQYCSDCGAHFFDVTPQPVCADCSRQRVEQMADRWAEMDYEQQADAVAGPDGWPQYPSDAAIDAAGAAVAEAEGDDDDGVQFQMPGDASPVDLDRLEIVAGMILDRGLTDDQAIDANAAGWQTADGPVQHSSGRRLRGDVLRPDEMADALDLAAEMRRYYADYADRPHRAAP